VGIGFIGAGNYARRYLLPNLPKSGKVVLKGVMTSSGTSSRTVAEKYGFEFCTSNDDDIYGDDGIETVFIATRHNAHADYALKALKAGKHVFVEKPLCTKESELADITETYSSLTSQHSTPSLMVGFNRRFSPLAKILKERLGVGPMAMIYRINAGPIPSNAWIQDPDIGGGRIIGEVCHFVDFLTFLNGSLPQCLFATAMQDPAGTEDTVNVNLRFRNGSIGTVSYFSNGSKSFFKEYVESHRAGTTAVLKDFRELEIHDGKRTFRKRLFYQDKGQKQMVKAFVESIGNGKPSPVPFHEISAVTLATFKILQSLKTGEVCQLSG
jgi:predicted dehydrogenase